VLDSNKVYIDGFLAEITGYTASALTIRRPNRTGESTTIKVVNYETIGHATYTPYKIDPVFKTYGGFIENQPFVAVDVDKDENVYLVQRTPRSIHKIEPDGNKTILGEASRNVTDMKVAPDGQLVLLCANRDLYKFDVNTGVETEWISQGERVSFGDFDVNGNFYTGGRRTGVVVIKTDLSDESLDFYSGDEILCVRVFEGAVYFLVVAARPDDNTPELAVWKHEIQNANGALGDGTLVVDWAVFGADEDAVPAYFTFSESGLIVLGSDNSQPIFTYDMNSGTADTFYKDILPAGAVAFSWGTGDYLYMIQGGDKNDLIRIDMGMAGAPYYGR